MQPFDSILEILKDGVRTFDTVFLPFLHLKKMLTILSKNHYTKHQPVPTHQPINARTKSTPINTMVKISITEMQYDFRPV